MTRRTGGPIGSRFAPTSGLLSAAKSGRLSFGEYEPLYLAEMRESYRWNRGEWAALLARPRVVLCCYCVDPAECHRSLLAGILGKLGAELRGEVGLADAVAAVRAKAPTGTITARDIVIATASAGAEFCVVWTVLHRAGVIALSYDEAKARGLLAAVRKMRLKTGAMVDEPPAPR